MTPNPDPSQAAENDEEMLDLLDAEGRVIGTVRRGLVHGDPSLRHRAVHVFVVNAAGDFYLQKRSARKKVQPDKWDTSVGGHVPSGESYEEGARRELEEELGVPLEDPSALRFHHDFVWSNDFETEHIRTFVLRYEGPFRLQAAEVSDGRFWSFAELRAAVGKGVLTPNLEAELRLMGVTP